ncbi:VirB4 family type IV secretion system protein [Embleya sp. NPDC059237]|uniref:VirB4 family type IV secretion system protein n=1 Tax=Embleya sp. NPDC059237 TaxID=3346784 RepID=UPI00367EC85D
MKLQIRLPTSGRRRHGAADGRSDGEDAGSPRELLPDAVVVRPRMLGVGGHLASTLVVTGYPAEVGPGWLEPLLAYPGRLDVALHVEPVPANIATQRLRKQRARLESTRRHDADKGRLDDPETEAAADAAADLAYRVAKGEGKLFRVGLYLTVHADDEAMLGEELAAVAAIAESLLLRTVPVTFRSLQGWLSTLPLGVDLVGVRRTMDTAALAAAFPLASPDLPTPDPADAAAPTGGVLYGVNTMSSGLVIWDRWAQPNHNSVTLARSGAGKSYLTKLELLRSLHTGVEAMVIDPEGEYTRLARAVGGTILTPGAPGVCINPFDLPPAPRRRHRNGDAAGGDALTRRALFVHTLLAVLLGGTVTAAERAVLDTAIMGAYRTAGITADPRTWARPAPLLFDLQTALVDADSDVAHDLAARLAPYTTGTHRCLFESPTTTRPDGHLVVWNLRELPDELKPVGMLLTLDAIWRRVTDPTLRRRRLVVVDEAWLLMRESEGGRFLFRMAKAARKYWAGLAVVSQDADDVLGSDLGRAVVANSATQILLRQAPQAVDHIAETFDLSAGERDFLLSADQGEGLLLAGVASRVSFVALAADAEHALITTDPGELTHDFDPDDDGEYADTGEGFDVFAEDDEFGSYADEGFDDDPDGSLAGSRPLADPDDADADSDRDEEPWPDLDGIAPDPDPGRADAESAALPAAATTTDSAPVGAGGGSRRRAGRSDSARRAPR